MASSSSTDDSGTSTTSLRALEAIHDASCGYEHPVLSYTLVTILCLILLLLHDTRTIRYYLDHIICYSLNLKIVLPAYFLKFPVVKVIR